MWFGQNNNSNNYVQFNMSVHVEVPRVVNRPVKNLVEPGT